RVVPVGCGALLVPLSYFGCLRLGFARTTSLLRSVCVLFDNFFFSFSRVHLNDMPLCFFIASAIHLSFTATSDTYTHPAPAEIPVLCLQGLVMGCCLSAKYGMAIPIFAWVGLQNLSLLWR